MADEDLGRAEWLNKMREAGVGALSETMGIEVALDGDEVTGRMPVAGNTQPYGILHGGATGVLVETVGSIAAALNAGPDRIAMGIELSVTHHRAVSQGWVTATTETVQRGKTLMSFVVPVLDEQGRRIATGRLTCLLRDAPN